jgi:hypothetical protein
MCKGKVTETLEGLITHAKALPAMTEEEQSEQAAEFAYGTLAMTREYDNATPEELEKLRQLCRKAAGLK